jgi:hypothetical protein
MKRRFKGIALLAVVLSLMATTYVYGVLWCYDLAACVGAAGCALGGSPDPQTCRITCVGGGYAQCEKRQGG